jgi:lysophospholipid acyltransferase (LPLAT)-like uncharacterized protein
MTGRVFGSAIQGSLGSVFVRSLFATARLRREGEGPLDALRAEGRPVVFAFWHGHQLPLLHYHRNQGIITLVSRHRDGEHVARVLDRAGFGTVRGSSTRGGARGLRGLIRSARAGHDVAITPDGPQGPRRTFKPGALLVSRLTGHPIIPVAAGISRVWRLGSWDGFLVPKPFANIRIAYGAPVFVPRKEEDGPTEEYARRIEVELNRLSALVGDAQ